MYLNLFLFINPLDWLYRAVIVQASIVQLFHNEPLK